MAVSGHPYDATIPDHWPGQVGQNHGAADAALDLDRFVRTYEANTTREWGPYPGCEACQAVCFYRSEVRRLVSSNDMGHARGILGSPAFRSVEERYAELGKLLKAVVEQWLGGHFSETKNLGYQKADLGVGA